MSVNKNEITKEMIEKAMQCKNADELLAAAKEEGIDLTKDEAEAYMGEMDDIELDETMLKNVAGGEACYMIDCPSVRACAGRGGAIPG